MEKYAVCFTGNLWVQLLAANNLTRATYAANKRFISCPGGYGATNDRRHAGEAQIGGGAREDREPGCKQGSLYLDQNCKLIPAGSITAEKKSCGEISYYAEMATPISLVWSDDYTRLPSTMVSFKLNPYSSKSTWLWRGSESLPLLVFDPEHTGSITSAKQLFGSWAFGGKHSSSDEQTPGTPWKDGYEALATMDKDGDGKVAGVELDKLALWFDTNRDGVSQQGEVKRFSVVSVSALFYKTDKSEAGALIATKGFERILDGEVKTFSSIDWVENNAAEPFEPLLDQKHTPGARNTSPENLPAALEQGTTTSIAPHLAGVWRWSLTEPAEGEGYFTFDESENGFAGSSVSLVGIDGISEVSSEVLFTHFERVSVQLRDQGVDVSFLAKSVNGATLSSSGILSADGSALSGKTVVTGSTSSQNGTYEYNWVAQRIE